MEGGGGGGIQEMGREGGVILRQMLRVCTKMRQYTGARKLLSSRARSHRHTTEETESCHI